MRDGSWRGLLIPAARSTRRAVAVITAAMTALAVSLLGPVAAQAAPQIELNINGSGFTANPVTALFNLNNLAPGQSNTGTVGVRNPYSDDGTLKLQATNVKNWENGCNGSEHAAGDTTCGGGSDQGELGAALVFSVEVSAGPVGPWTHTWSGSTADLEAVADVHVTVPASSDRYLRMTVTLPWTTGNEVQSDSIAFDLRVNLTSNAGTGGGVIPGGGGAPGNGGNGGNGGFGIGGVAVGPGHGGSGGHGPSRSGTGGLASTGVPVLMWSTAGLLFVCCGLLLISFGRDRRRTNDPV